MNRSLPERMAGCRWFGNIQRRQASRGEDGPQGFPLKGLRSGKLSDPLRHWVKRQTGVVVRCPMAPPV